MFPYKSNAFHAYEPKRNPLKSRTFASLIAIAMLLVVLAFSEARAEVASEDDCSFIEAESKSSLKTLQNMTQKFRIGDVTVEQFTQYLEGVDLKTTAQWATIYNAFCK